MVGAVLSLAVGVGDPGLAAPSGGVVVPPDVTNAAPTPTGKQHTITLITGDKVTVSTIAGGLSTTDVRGPSGQPVGARVMRYGPDTYVYPDSVARYVSSGLLDKRLFNITKLLADGYDDASRDRLPLILSYSNATARAKSALTGAQRVRDLPSVQGAAVEEPRSTASTFWNALTGTNPAAPAAKQVAGQPASFLGGVTKVWLDGKVRAALTDTTTQIGAPQVWSGGNTGAGVPVAVLDTGVDPEHPDLADQIAETRSFVPGETVIDRVGHGTHVASTIAGTGAASGGVERGVAPGVKLHIGKVLNDEGEGQDSWILGGMEWAVREAKAKVVNMSLGGGPSDGTDLLSASVNRLSAETGALFVIAAGNSQDPGYLSLSSPGAADAALTVGAVDSRDQLAPFSNWGPRLGDNAPKPDITAPGVGVLAARSQYASGEGSYVAMNGTSMATPHVAGAAALLAAAHSDWTGQQLKDVLMSTSKRTPRLEIYRGGSGRVDVAAAVSATLFSDGVKFTAEHWPYAPGQRSEQKITYTNTGDAPVTLNLSVHAPTAPAGLFSLAADQVVVPAHGTSSLVVYANLDLLKDEAFLSGGTVIGADAQGVPLAHTVVAVNKEGQRVGLTINTKDRDGTGLAGQILLKDITDTLDPQLYTVDDTGRLDLRVRPGTYSILMYAPVTGANGPSSLGLAALVAPEVIVGDNGATVTLDGRTLRQVQAITPKPTSLNGIRIDYFRSYPNEYPLSDNYHPDAIFDSVWATPTGKRVSQGAFHLGFRWSAIEPPLTLSGAHGNYDDLRFQAGSPNGPEGRHVLDAAFVPGSTPSDITTAKVRGKVAVVRYTDNATAQAQVDAAAAAGARLMVIVNTGLGRLDAWNEALEPKLPLPVVSLGHQQGEELIERIRAGEARLTVVGIPTPAYLYDLIQRHNGAVPTDLTYQPRAKDLAKVKVSFRNPTQDIGNWNRYDLSTEKGVFNSLRDPVPFAAQGERTDWLSAEPGIRWVESAKLGPIYMYSRPLLSYPKGSTTNADWFAPVTRPRLLNPSFVSGVPAVVGNELSSYTLPTWGDSNPQHEAKTFGVEVAQSFRVYQGADLISESVNGTMSTFVEPGQPLRLVNETTQSEVSAYATRTQTEWTVGFPDADPESVRQLPLIQLDYAVDLDLTGRAKRKGEVTVSASHLAGAWHGGAFRSATVELSYDDGRTWQRAATQRGEKASWQLDLNAPKSAQYVSTRVTATDVSGNTVQQTVERAFGLR